MPTPMRGDWERIAVITAASVSGVASTATVTPASSAAASSPATGVSDGTTTVSAPSALAIASAWRRAAASPVSASAR